MPGDDSETNISVIISRLKRIEHDYNDMGADVSKAHERLNYIERDRPSRAEVNADIQTVIAHQKELEIAQNSDSKKLVVVADRLSWITLLLGTLTIISSAIAAYIGKLP